MFDQIRRSSCFSLSLQAHVIQTVLADDGASLLRDTATGVFIYPPLCAQEDMGHVKVEYGPLINAGNMSGFNQFNWLWLRPESRHYLVLGVAQMDTIEMLSVPNVGNVVNIMPPWRLLARDCIAWHSLPYSTPFGFQDEHRYPPVHAHWVDLYDLTVSWQTLPSYGQFIWGTHGKWRRYHPVRLLKHNMFNSQLTSSISLEYASRWRLVQKLHRAIDHYLEHSLCRLDDGRFCVQGLPLPAYAFSYHNGSTSAPPPSRGFFTIAGHTGEAKFQTEFLFDAAFEFRPNRICEVGFNAGHSALTLLLATGDSFSGASYVGFDWSVINPGVNEIFFDMLQAWLPESQFRMFWGDEVQGVQEYIDQYTEKNAKCDLVFYDGSHELLRMLKVLPQLRNVTSRKRHVLLVDDVGCGDHTHCAESTYAWEFLIWAGFVRKTQCTSEIVGSGQNDRDSRTICAGTFIYPSEDGNPLRCETFNARCVYNAFKAGASFKSSRCCSTVRNVEAMLKLHE